MYHDIKAAYDTFADNAIEPTVRTSLRLPQSIKNLLTVTAATEGVSENVLVQVAVQAYVAQLPPEKAQAIRLLAFSE